MRALGIAPAEDCGELGSTPLALKWKVAAVQPCPIHGDGNSRVTVTRKTLEASVCRESLYDFVQRFWHTVIHEEPVWNWHIRYICDTLQEVADRALRREHKKHDLIINVSPGSTKSTICSVMFPVWCWTRDPTFRVICGSYAFPLSLHLASQSWRILDSDKFRELFPEVVMQQESRGLLETTEGGQRIATSTGGSITGMHGHVIVIDDPLNPKEAVSDTQLRSANDWFDHTLMTRMVDRRVTPVVLIMQRLHQNDPTAHLLERKTQTPLRHICLPAELDDTVRPRALRQFYRDGLFDPVRLPQRVLDAAKIELGQYAYAGQYGQKPVPQGGGMFRIDAIQVLPSAPAFRWVIRYWDKAGTVSAPGKAKRGAWTVGVLMGMTLSREFVISDVVRGQWEAAERERIIRQTAERDGKGVWVAVEQEPGSGGKESAQGTLKNLAGWRIKIDRPVGDKVLRADPFAVQVNGGNVRIVRAIWNAAYLAELQFFPFSKYKDQVDASSGAFAIITGKRIRVGAF